MGNDENETTQKNARILVNNIFYYDEEVKLLADLLGQHLDSKVHTPHRQLLLNLIEAMYYSIQLISSNNIFVAKKIRKRKKAKKAMPEESLLENEEKNLVIEGQENSTLIPQETNEIQSAYAEETNPVDEVTAPDIGNEEEFEDFYSGGEEEYESDAESMRELPLDIKKYLLLYTPNKVISIFKTYLNVELFSRSSKLARFSSRLIS
jgi:hypothetical protein